MIPIWSLQKHFQRCHVCKSAKLCYQIQQVGSHLSTRLCTSLVTVILLLLSSILISFGGQKSTFIAQERNISENYTFAMYLCYLVYAPLYISGPIISFNAFASQVCDYISMLYFHIPSTSFLYLYDRVPFV